MTTPIPGLFGYTPWQARAGGALGSIGAGLMAAGAGGWQQFAPAFQQAQAGAEQQQQDYWRNQMLMTQFQQAQEDRDLQKQEREAAAARAGKWNEFAGLWADQDPTNDPFALQPSQAGLLPFLDYESGPAQVAEWTKAPEEKLSDDMREYNLYVEQGGKDDFFTYMTKLKRAGATTNTNKINLKQYGDIPAGYRLVDDGMGGVSMEKVPGSPADEAAQNRGAMQEQTADVVTTDINRALEKMDSAFLPTTGAGGALLQYIPGTAARDVAGLVQTVRSNIGIDKLQQMRDASKTGGALGSVTEKELAELQSVVGNLEQSQSDEQVRYNLKRVYNKYLDVVHGPGLGPQRYQLEQPRGPAASDTTDLKSRYGLE